MPKQKRTGNKQIVEVGVGKVTLRGIISNHRKLKIYILHGEDAPISAGEIDLSKDSPVYSAASSRIDLSGEGNLLVDVEFWPVFSEFWIDFLDRVATVERFNTK